MSKLASQLIKLGHEKPELRDHLRPVLNKIAGSKVEPLEVDYVGRPLYFAEDVNNPKTGIQKAQEGAFGRKYRLALKHASNGKLKSLLEQVLRAPVPAGDFEIDRLSTGGMVEGDDDETQNWARLMLTLKGAGSLSPGYSEMQAMHKVVHKAYSVHGECSAQVSDLGVYKDELILEITWWGAQWDESMVEPHREKIRREEMRVRREKELQKELAEEAARMKDPAYIASKIEADLRSALRSLDSGGGRYVSVGTDMKYNRLYGSYRSDLPEGYDSYDEDYDEYSDDYGGLDEYEYDDMSMSESSRAEEVIADYLSEHSKYIKSIEAELGDKNYIEVTVDLK